MSGRYLTTIFLCSVVLLTREIGFSSNPEYMIIIALLLIGITTPNPPLLNNLSTASENRYHGVSDTKANSYEYTSLWNINIMNPQLHGVQYEKGMLARETQKRITIGKASGKFAFYAGPDHHVVDTFALGDALLARLPPREQVNFHIGHFVRDVPKGYWKNYWSYGDKIQDPSLAEYYQKLSIVIHGNTLFSKQRFIEIWRLNTGYYDHLIDEYLVREAAP